MSNNKQSSVVDWIFSKLIEKNLLMIYGKPLEDSDLIEIIEQAKAMHKEEHGKTWDDSMSNFEVRGMNIVRAWVDFDEYYKETYK